jgi:hypothetical protein
MPRGRRTGLSYSSPTKPLLTMHMYEQSCQMDYGAAAAQ